MNTSKFNSHKDYFRVLNLVACLKYKTRGSISFSIGRFSLGNCVAGGCGWLDVHCPCDGHIKVQIRLMLPDEYYEQDKFKAIIDSVFEALEIPRDETYEVRGHKYALGGIYDVQPCDREGYSDRMMD